MSLFLANCGTNAKPAVGGGSGDADVDAFITATGISDPTIETAIFDLVTDLKAAGIWAKCTAIYPFVGGDATKHSYNLKNPAAFQITWNGTVTHDANGFTGNGTTGYGNTSIVPSTHLTEDDVHLSLYCRTSAGLGSARDMGAVSNAGTRNLALNIRFSNFFLAYAYATSTSHLEIANTDAQGFWISSRRSNADFEGCENGSSIITNTNADGAAQPGTALYLGCRNNNGTAAGFSDRNYAFASIGSGLTDTESADFFTAVEAFQDALSRGVV